MICKESVSRAAKKAFGCRRHFGHRGCVNQYNRSAMGRNGQYKCPVKCGDIAE